ncbi:hypothetical protein I317_00336 [Kwoniella heveanensis CBS 569]|nr:hypothetical protein I317_00336 [Kwoniella heveanensis CBS 569]
MPSRPASYPSSVLSLIQSTSYGSIPSLTNLEDIHATLSEHAAFLGSRLPESSSSSAAVGKGHDKKKRKDRDDDDRERAALEANERAGARLEALERARVEHQRNGPHGKARTGTGSPSGVKIKRERLSISPAPSNASSASFRPNHPHGTPITYGGQMKKKKKRVLDSDDEAQSQSRDRSMTLNSPPSQIGYPSHPGHAHPHQSSTSGLKLKLSHTHPQFKGSRPTTDLSPTPSASTSNMIDFSLPPPPVRPLIPARPGVQKPMKPGPKKQSEVDEDYSNAKAPSQIAFPTFWSGVEPYLKDVKEDDLAMLGFKADAPESYEVPARGRHYTEVWDEEDGNPPGTTPRFPIPALRQEQLLEQQPNGAPPPVPHFVPVNELQETTLIEEQRGLGSLTERVVAAFVGRFGFGHNHGGDKKDSSDQDKESKDASASASAPNLESEMEDREPAKVDVAELEERMKKELKGVMLLGEHEEFDPRNREDDEVTSSLRQCQRLLSQQTAINDARKNRLAEIAKQRLAYTEYTSALEGIEKSIEAAWAKRIKKYGTTPKKSNSNHGNSQANGSGRPPVPETMKKLVDIRKHWIEVVGAKMKERPRGEMVGIPAKSIYEGIGGDDEEKDEKSVEDEVDLIGEEIEVDMGQ